MNWETLLNVVWAGGLVVGGWLLGSWGAGFVGALLARTRLDPLVRDLIRSAIFPLVMVVSVAAALEKLGAFSGGVAAVLGTVGLGLVLALQGTLSNVAAGTVLLSVRPFNIGDEVELEGVGGRLASLGLFAISIETDDGQIVTVLNTKVLLSLIRNHSRNSLRRVEAVVPIPRLAWQDSMVEEALALAADDPRVLVSPPPRAVVDEVGLDRVVLKVRVWCPGDVRADVGSQLRRRLLSRLPGGAVPAV
jgi:small conductance mechanosensitive channel